MEPPITIPGLHALLTIVTSLTLEELAKRTGDALSVVFRMDTEGDFEELNALTAHVLSHIIGLYQDMEAEHPARSNAPHRENKPESELPTRYSLDIRPHVSSVAIGIDHRNSDFVDLWVSEFFAAFLRYETGLPWEAVQILPP